MKSKFFSATTSLLAGVILGGCATEGMPLKEMDISHSNCPQYTNLEVTSGYLIRYKISSNGAVLHSSAGIVERPEPGSEARLTLTDKVMTPYAARNTVKYNSKNHVIASDIDFAETEYGANLTVMFTGNADGTVAGSFDLNHTELMELKQLAMDGAVIELPELSTHAFSQAFHPGEKVSLNYGSLKTPTGRTGFQRKGSKKPLFLLEFIACPVNSTSIQNTHNTFRIDL